MVGLQGGRGGASRGCCSSKASAVASPQDQMVLPRRLTPKQELTPV